MFVHVTTSKHWKQHLDMIGSSFEGCKVGRIHYNDVIMGAMASQITSLAIVYSTVYLGADQRKHQSSATLAFVRGIHRGPVLQCVIYWEPGQLLNKQPHCR